MNNESSLLPHGLPKYWREVTFEKAPDAVMIVFALKTSGSRSQPRALQEDEEGLAYSFRRRSIHDH